MGLDVHLYKKNTCKCPHCGGDVEIGHEEVYWANITHNLSKMASKVNVLHNTLHEYLWEPEGIDIKNSSDLVYPLTIGLAMLKDNPEYYKQFDSPNGWGLYEHFVPFVERYLNACIENPDCDVYASR